MKCVLCNSYELSIMDSRILTPKPYQKTFARFECPNCHGILASTNLSRFFCVLVLILSIVAGVFIALEFMQPASENSAYGVSIVTALVIGYSIDYFVLPLIIRVKKWETLADTLPKSRFMGYTLFLIVPLIIIFSLFFLGIHFEIGR